MPSRDFDAQRTAALANQFEELSFTLFGRTWTCTPMLSPLALSYVAKVRESTAEVDILHGGLSFVGAVVEDRDAWDVALRGAVIDGDTLLDLTMWLATEYAKRYQPPKVEQGPEISPPNRTSLAELREVIGRAGGEVG